MNSQAIKRQSALGAAATRKQVIGIVIQFTHIIQRDQIFDHEETRFTKATVLVNTNPIIRAVSTTLNLYF